MKLTAILVTISTCLVATAAELPPPAADMTAEELTAEPETGNAFYIVSKNELNIRQAIIDDNEYNRKKYSVVPEIKLITIHNTAEPYTAMQERTRVNTRTNSVTSFQFTVDEHEAVQILPDNSHGWHAGDGNGAGNMSSIGIEICRSQCIGDENYLYNAAEENAVKLCAYLLEKYNLTVDDMRMHNDWTGKHCPHRILDAGSWENFKTRVQKLTDENKLSKAVNTTLIAPAPADSKHDMGGINISEKNGVITFNTMYGENFKNIDELVTDLAKQGITTVTISSWIMDYDMSTLFSMLEKNGVEIEKCYVPVKNVPNWVRKNLVEKNK